ncbi:hypothetical protein JCM19296_1669 [Nonlabens ulvanivorans]|uniref:Uncharacterized protein n=1 Tax=Nonlabens ulvanivorans TaxID=906888 RepID=A0A081DAX6_NONUL|nr:hypothetical protein [Nonlabens ulvanivorans]GAK76072.1 hypothetical protein JCM19296_1669 [Nonlabens ulvanivorans]
MKTKKINYLLLACIVLLVTACNWPTDTPETALDCSGDGHGIIQRSQGVQMVNDFNQINQTIINENLSYINTNGDSINVSHTPEVHFNLDDMKCFIEYVESFEGEYENLGIRAYLAAQNDPTTNNYKTTIIFAPTGYPVVTTGSAIFPQAPNIPGADLLNHGNAGMPPVGTGLSNP